MKKEEMIKLIEDIYSMPMDTLADFQNLKDKIIDAGNNVDESKIETVFECICLNAFAQSLD